MTRYVNPSKKPWNEVVSDLKETFGAWGIPFQDFQIERAGRYGTGAKVTYRPLGSPNVVTMFLESQYSAAKNLSAIAITIEGIRMQERRGLGAITAQHYLALEAPKLERDPYEILQARPDADRETIDTLFRLRAKASHPDTGGTQEEFELVTGARDRIYEQRGWGA